MDWSRALSSNRSRHLRSHLVRIWHGMTSALVMSGKRYAHTRSDAGSIIAINRHNRSSHERVRPYLELCRQQFEVIHGERPLALQNLRAHAGVDAQKPGEARGAHGVFL